MLYVAHVESTFQNTRPWDRLCVPRIGLGPPLYTELGICVFVPPPPYTLTAICFVEGFKAGCSSCGGPAVGFWLRDANLQMGLRWEWRSKLCDSRDGAGGADQQAPCMLL